MHTTIEVCRHCLGHREVLLPNRSQPLTCGCCLGLGYIVRPPETGAVWNREFLHALRLDEKGGGR